MSHIFDFGISQDDASIEKQALDIKDGDNLLCISSAGEVPLNLLALNNIKVKAVDISVNQNHLVKLKLNAVRSLEPLEAAKFIGFMDTTPEHRNQLYKKVSELLNEDDIVSLPSFQLLKSVYSEYLNDKPEQAKTKEETKKLEEKERCSRQPYFRRK